MKSASFTGYNRCMKENSRELRKHMTPQERKLWYGYLRDYPYKFYRQRSIGGYIVDFYCSVAHLVIEVDGGQHYEPAELDYDARRTAFLQNYGLEVVRVTNRDVDRNLRGVCDFIDMKIGERGLKLPERTP